MDCLNIEILFWNDVEEDFDPGVSVAIFDYVDNGINNKNLCRIRVNFVFICS